MGRPRAATWQMSGWEILDTYMTQEYVQQGGGLTLTFVGDRVWMSD